MVDLAWNLCWFRFERFHRLPHTSFVNPNHPKRTAESIRPSGVGGKSQKEAPSLNLSLQARIVGREGQKAEIASKLQLPMSGQDMCAPFGLRVVQGERLG